MRIGIVNDMRLAVESLRRAVATIPDATVAWIAEDGAQAVARCAAERPDLILMDMIMPVMDGVEATRRIMAATPCPILVVTATVEGNAGKVFEALGAGALDAVATPGLGPDGRPVNVEALVRKVHAIRMIAGEPSGGGGAVPQSTAPAVHSAPRAIPPLVAIGTSTGGPLALAVILKAIPHPAPWPIVIIQHVDPEFAPGLASWLASETGHAVSTISIGGEPAPGHVVIAATRDHALLTADGHFRYSAEPRELVYRPSVDVFFNSLAAAEAAPGVAVVLTGMGRDGALGLSRLRAAGWSTIAQDRATSVVWGMPGACVELNAAMQTLPLNLIAPAITSHMTRIAPRAPSAQHSS
jgi:two-component system response regulator WspF